MTPVEELRTRSSAGELRDDRSLRDVVGSVIDDVRSLVRGEIALARAEAEQKLTRVAMALASIVAGVLLGFAALNVLLAALVAALDEGGLGLPTWAAATIVAVVVAGLGYGLVKSGQNALELKKLVPERTTANLEADARMVKDQMT